MNDDLELAIKNALALSGSSTEANKAYLEFIKANFLVPIDKSSNPQDPSVLFLVENNHTFLPVFTGKNHLDAWAYEISDAINVLTLSGVDLLKGLGEEITICLNIGSPYYKEFNPAEIARMRSLVLKIFKT